MLRPIAGLARPVRRWLRERSLWTYPTLLVLAAFPLVLTRGALFGPGYPNGGELFSNLVPALHARHALSAGHLPVYAEGFYAGRYQFLNPLWYGFYPPAWLLFVPFVPLDVASKLLIAAHVAVVPLVAYYYASRDRRDWVAAAFSLVWVLPIAAQVRAGHLEKIFAWPWFVLLAWQLTPERLAGSNRRPASVAGFAIGAMLLAGGNYYAAFAGLLLGCLVVATGSWTFLKRAVIAGLVGVPHLLSVVPPLFSSIERPPGRAMGPLGAIQLLTGLFDVWVFDTALPVTPGYAVVGLGAVGLGLVGCYRAFEDDRRWCVGLLGASAVGLSFVTGAVYALPLADVLRTGTRANVVLALVVLLFAWYALRDWNEWSVTARLPAAASNAVVGLVVVASVVHGSAGWVLLDHESVSPDVGEEVAASLEKTECETTWIEPGSRLDRNERLPDDLQIAFAATERGIATRSLHYGAIGQEWVVRDGSGYTFDSLVVGERLDEGSHPLYGDWYNEKVGEIDSSDFSLLTRVSTSDGPVFVYAGDCGQ